MRKKPSHHTGIRILEEGIVVFVVVGVMLWQNALAYTVSPVTPVPAPIAEFIPALVLEIPVLPPLSQLPLPLLLAVPQPVKKINTPLAVKPIIEAHPPVIQPGLGLPVRLNIPSIGVNAPIKPVAQTSAGAMAVPANNFETGWYQLGPKPGEIGSAVIAGHVKWPVHADAVFADLNKLKPGDKITVQNDRGESVTFVVRETRVYDFDADATDVFLSHDGQAHLNIITCDGLWDTVANQYLQRLIVFADKLEV